LLALTRSASALKGTTISGKIKPLAEKGSIPAAGYQSVLSSSDLDEKTLSDNASAALKSSYLEADKDVQSSKLLLTSDINFLRKEVVYTKLKYSRSPQYDAVSGGFAALFAGFIGFLISEKFGIELVDSGDFFIGLMYVIFIGFTGRLLLVTSSNSTSPRFSVSPLHNLTFFKEVTLFILRKLSFRL
jgi:hypothetical protein